MKTRRLGNTDLVVSRICFGCWQLSPRYWGDVPVEPWEQALRRALDLGVNFVDTANAYGNGHAEDCLGRFLEREGLRDRLVVATKFYWNFRDDPYHPDTTAAYITEECENSLRRLRTDRIDLYQVHAFDPLTRPGAVGETLQKLKQQGKVRWFGVSNLNPEQMRLYAPHFRIDSLQPPYSLVQREVEQEELPFCQANGIGVIPYSPLYRGLLTGKYEPDHTFSDSRSEDPLFRGDAFKIMLDAVHALQPFAGRHGLTLPQFSIRWLLTHPAVTSAIVGIKKPEHIETIVAAAEQDLPMGDWFHAGNTVAEAKRKALEAAGTC